MSEASGTPAELIAEGVACCRRGDWHHGKQLLGEAAKQETPGVPYPGFFYTYLGLAIARCEGRTVEGVRLARDGVAMEPRDPQNRLNLAQAYLLNEDRRRAVRQLKIGLQISPRHHGLRKLRRQMGYRREPFFKSLSRDFFLNRWLGRFTYRSARR